MSRPAIKIAKLSMVIGLVVMMLAVAVVLGFKREVREQIIGFGGHIQITPFANFYNDDHSEPIVVNDSLITVLSNIENVRRTQAIAMTAAMIKTDSDFKGIVLKGVDSLYDWTFFNKNMVEGRSFIAQGDSTEVVKNGAIISQAVSKQMGVGVGDKITFYFFKERMRARKLTITGVYSTSFTEYDNTFIITDAKIVQQLNKWDASQFSAIEILVDDYDEILNTSDDIFLGIGNRFQNGRIAYNIKTIQEVAPVMFDWLDMLDINTIIILILMILVSGFCMISGLLIIILERRDTIGLLKALGANNSFIRRIFLWQSSKLIFKSMLWGNVIACLIIFVEWQWQVIPLNAEYYYVDHVPVYMNLGIFCAINVGVFAVSTLMMIAPTYLATRISPVEAMRME